MRGVNGQNKKETFTTLYIFKGYISDCAIVPLYFFFYKFDNWQRSDSVAFAGVSLTLLGSLYDNAPGR